mmetsp:Transcript_32070/g.70145  ORF Transcript_32070/g.70145 Transcript_32070/m.70145 type:complete len:854 (-) Transcript_32070:48-2609(-)
MAARKGWHELLEEISVSSRRLRVARGGHIGAKAASVIPRRPETARGTPHRGRRVSVASRATVAATEAAASTLALQLNCAAATGSKSQGQVLVTSSSPENLETRREVPSPASAALRCLSPSEVLELSRSRAESGRPSAIGISSPVGHPSSPGSPGDAAEPEKNCWRSYRVDEEKVPDSVLDILWRRAAEPKVVQEELQPLDKVPRLTVTTREVQNLPVVHDIQYWRQEKKRRKEQRKAKAEAERFPDLDEMLQTIFGKHEPPKMREQLLNEMLDMIVEEEELLASEAQILEPISDETAVRSAVRSQLLAEAFPVPKEYVVENSALGTAIPTLMSKGLPYSNNKSLTNKEVTVAEWGSKVVGVDQGDGWLRAGDRFIPIIVMGKRVLMEVPGSSPSSPIGVRQKGRRGAFDEGQPGNRAVAALAGPGEQRANSKKRASKLLRLLEAAKAAENPLDERIEHMKELLAASQRVTQTCQRKVTRMHAQFLRKKGLLNLRLQRRVERLRIDFEEIHDLKVGSILPSVVTRGGADSHTKATGRPSSSRGSPDNVLQYLAGHRKLTERARLGHHSAYLSQVERFEGCLQRLADPNRAPDRGEIYLGECFRHVLAAGLIVDNVYFFRVLMRLEAEDYERVPTVNLIAACCEAFDVDLRLYWSFLEGCGLPRLAPRARPDQVRSWEDWAPWRGVDLQEPSDLTRPCADDVQEMCQDPFPFRPVLPDEQPTESEFVSREDPLTHILREAPLDAVLGRYLLEVPGALREASAPRRSQASDASQGCKDQAESDVLGMEMTPRSSVVQPFTKPFPRLIRRMRPLLRKRGTEELRAPIPFPDRPQDAARAAAPLAAIAERPYFETPGE